jgi:SnoaL-like polyketide cyclase
MPGTQQAPATASKWTPSIAVGSCLAAKPRLASSATHLQRANATTCKETLRMTTQSRPLDPTPSPTEVPERFGEEVLNDKNFSAIDEIAADDYVEPDPRPGQAPGRDGLKALLETKLFPAFPDGQWIDEEQGAEGDKVVTRFTFYGTHQGTFMGIPPTGRRVAVGGNGGTGELVLPHGATTCRLSFGS